MVIFYILEIKNNIGISTHTSYKKSCIIDSGLTIFYHK